MCARSLLYLSLVSSDRIGSHLGSSPICVLSCHMRSNLAQLQLHVSLQLPMCLSIRSAFMFDVSSCCASLSAAVCAADSSEPQHGHPGTDAICSDQYQPSKGNLQLGLQKLQKELKSNAVHHHTDECECFLVREPDLGLDTADIQQGAAARNFRCDSEAHEHAIGECYVDDLFTRGEAKV